MSYFLKLLNADYQHVKRKQHEVIHFLKSIPSGQSILDIGAGEMPYRKYCEHLRYKSHDLCNYDGLGDSLGIQTAKFNTSDIDIVSDITKIPLLNESEDNILCTEVLEHVVNPIDAILEMERILKDGGRIFITVPGTSLLHFSPYHYYTGFKVNFFKYFLPKAGFIIDEIMNVGSIYSVASLYFWHIADKISKVICPKKPFLFFLLILISITPLFGLLFMINKLRILKSDNLEAGLIVIAHKQHENSHRRK